MLNNFSLLITNLDNFMYVYGDPFLKMTANIARTKLQLWCAAKSVINACIWRFEMSLSENFANTSR